MSPPFIFKIDELRENPNISPIANAEGHWKPSIKPQYNYILGPGQGVSGKYWYSQGGGIRELPPQSVPNRPEPFVVFSTHSLFYARRHAFWVLNGNVTDLDPESGEVWNPLRFDHRYIDRSSYVTEAGQEETLDLQRSNQAWPHMLLDTNYHGRITTNPRYGGLVGELSLFLGLVAMSMEAKNLLDYLPRMMDKNQWQVHNLRHGRKHQRGVVVTVYHCPTNWAKGGSREELEDYEQGTSVYGKYYD